MEHKIGEIFKPQDVEGRPFDINDLFGFMKAHSLYLMSWGFQKMTILKRETLFSFQVNGHHHKGLVYVYLDWSDTFTCIFTDKKHKIVRVEEMVYIDEFMDRLDSSIERIPEYVK
jgi:hypothetical protein